jgi:hypothetical protein
LVIRQKFTAFIFELRGSGSGPKACKNEERIFVPEMIIHYYKCLYQYQNLWTYQGQNIKYDWMVLEPHGIKLAGGVLGIKIEKKTPAVFFMCGIDSRS